MQRTASDPDRPYRKFTRFAVALIIATIAIGVSGLQYRSDALLPVTVTERTSGEAVQPGVATKNNTAIWREKPWQAWHVAELPPRGDKLRWLRLSTVLDGDIADVGGDKTRPPIAATWFTRQDGTRQKVAPTPLGAGILDSHEWRSIRSWPEHATQAVAAVNPRAMHGELQLSDFRVEIVSLSAPYRFLVVLLAGGWIALGVSVTGYMRPRFRGPAALTPLALVVLIAVAAMFSSDVIDNVVRPIVALLHGTRAGVPLVATFKIGHAVAFALLTCSLLVVRRRLELSIPQIVLLIMLLAVASEAAQLHLPARNAQLSDLGIDMLGMVSGIVLWRLSRNARAQWLTHLKSSRGAKRAAWAKSGAGR